MSKDDDFSLEQSEELIANFKSGAPSEFEQLRSTLNLLAHVPELPPTSIPPVLPSSISQPVPVLPMKSSKTHRTVVTSIMITGFFASASLAAAAVTGIGPAAIVNVGHQAAKFVKGVVGGVTHVVTGNPSDATQKQAASQQAPLAIPSLSPAPTGDEQNTESDSEKSTLIIPLLSSLFPPATTESSSHENDSQKPSHETQGPNTEDSSPVTPGGEKKQTYGEEQKQPSAHPSSKPTPEATDENSNGPTPAPSDGPSSEPTPSDEPSDEPSSEPTPSDEP